MRDFKSARAPEPNQKWLRLRVKLLAGFFVALLVAAFGRAVQLQVFERDKLRGLAQDQYVRQIEIPARRGDIFDRRGTPFAQVAAVRREPSRSCSSGVTGSAVRAALRVGDRRTRRPCP